MVQAMVEKRGGNTGIDYPSQISIIQYRNNEEDIPVCYSIEAVSTRTLYEDLLPMGNLLPRLFSSDCQSPVIS